MAENKPIADNENQDNSMNEYNKEQSGNKGNNGKDAHKTTNNVNNQSSDIPNNAANNVSENASEAAKSGFDAANAAQSAQNMAMNTVLAEKHNQNNTGEDIENIGKQTVKTAVNVAVAAGKASVGDIPGAVKDVISDKGVQNIAKVLIAILVLVPILFFSMIPSVMYTPTEEAYGNNSNHSTFIDIIKNIFGGGDNVNLNEIHSTNETDIITLNALNSSSTSMDELIESGMIDEVTTKVAIDGNSFDLSNIDTAPLNAQSTMDKMIKATQNRLDKRIKALKNEAENEFNIRKNKYSDYKDVNFLINDSITSSSSAREAVKLLCLYSIQNDNSINNLSFKEYRQWLGDASSGFFFNTENDDKDGMYSSKGWNYIPKKWQGTMLPQKTLDEVNEKKKNGTYNENNYKQYFTSALGEIVKLAPEIDEKTWETTVTVNGKTHTEKHANITYNITLKSVDDICNDVVKFDEAVKKDSNGNPIQTDPATHREGYYKEMCGNGEGEGIIFVYFGISNVMTSGFYGNGNSVVQTALAELGYREYGNNGNKFGEYFNNNYQPWCNYFVSWCARQAGISEDIIPSEGYTGTTYNFYRQKGLAHSTAERYIPKPGDIVLHTPGNNGHIEIVVSYDEASDCVLTIGGNTSNNLEINGAVLANGDCVGMHNRNYSYWTYYCEVPYPNVAGDGSYIDIPAGLGTYETYMGYHLTTAAGAPETELKNKARNTGRYKAQSMYGMNNCATIDNRLVIATVSNIGNEFPVSIGDYVDVVFDDGSVWNCIIGETKSQVVTWYDSSPANIWGHDNGRVIVEIVYHDYSQGCINQHKKVARIIKVGSY